MNVHPPEWAWSQSHLFCFCEQMMIKTRSAALSVPKMQPAGPIFTTTGHLQVKSKKVLHLDHFKQTTCVDIIKYSPKSRLASGKCRLWAASLTHSFNIITGWWWLTGLRTGSRFKPKCLVHCGLATAAAGKDPGWAESLLFVRHRLPAGR